MAAHSSALAWKIPWTEEPGRLRSMGSRRVRYNWATSLSLFTFLHWRRKWQTTPVLLPGESQGWGRAWWAAVCGVAQSQTRLKWLSSSSSRGKKRTELVWHRRPPPEHKAEDANGCRLGDRKKVALDFNWVFHRFQGHSPLKDGSRVEKQRSPEVY